MEILPSAIPQESRKAGGPRAGFKNGAGPRPRVSSVARRFAGTRYVFREEGSSFVPDGTRFVLARSPSDESLGYFRASLRDLGSRCL